MKHEYFTHTDKLKAMAIVSTFETGAPFPDFSAVAVLNDGAGVSYGFKQFTHASGSLALVLERYLQTGGQVGRTLIEERMSLVSKRSKSAINTLAADARFKNALRAAGVTHEMKQAQIEVAFSGFLQPAIDECFRLGFTSPLSLAVIYDSMVHGSWEKIRDRTQKSNAGPLVTGEHVWITNYVTARDAWLAAIPRLTATRYRTGFFINQIKRGNWLLELPLRVQGISLTKKTFSDIAQDLGEHPFPKTVSAVGPVPPKDPPVSSTTTRTPRTQTPPTTAQPPEEKGPVTIQAETRPAGSVSDGRVTRGLDAIEQTVNTAAAKYDQVERIATTVTRRNDAAKSLWTTVIGSISQTFWAIVSLLAGVPQRVWLVVAVIAGALMLLYLYRQIALGKIRERQVIGDKQVMGDK